MNVGPTDRTDGRLAARRRAAFIVARSQRPGQRLLIATPDCKSTRRSSADNASMQPGSLVARGRRSTVPAGLPGPAQRYRYRRRSTTSRRYRQTDRRVRPASAGEDVAVLASRQLMAGGRAPTLNTRSCSRLRLVS